MLWFTMCIAIQHSGNLTSDMGSVPMVVPRVSIIVDKVVSTKIVKR